MITVKTPHAPLRQFNTLADAQGYLRGAAAISPKCKTALNVHGRIKSGTALDLFHQLREGRITAPTAPPKGQLF